jgi:hypothetical protein
MDGVEVDSRAAGLAQRHARSGDRNNSSLLGQEEGQLIPREAINDVLAKGNGDYAALRHA